MWKFTAVPLLSLLLIANASPLIENNAQTHFSLSKDKVESTHHQHVASTNRVPSLESALNALRGASVQVVETFESVMSELGDASKHLTWSLPQKAVNARPGDWDFTVSTHALPEHSLRVKKPNNLGVDDVKQVQKLTQVKRSPNCIVFRLSRYQRFQTFLLLVLRESQ
jgi:hypothetical protein